MFLKGRGTCVVCGVHGSCLVCVCVCGVCMVTPLCVCSDLILRDHDLDNNPFKVVCSFLHAGSYWWYRCGHKFCLSS